MDSTLVWILVVGGIAIICAIPHQIKWEQKKQEAKTKTARDASISLGGIEGFITNDHYMSSDKQTGIAIDEKNEKLCFIKNQIPLDFTMIDYKDILSVELIEDGETITKTSRTSQVGGALLGGILLGGVGVVVGGLSGSKKTSNTTEIIALKVLVNNIKSPNHYIYFLNKKSKKSDPDYIQAIESARKWESVLNVIIRQVDDQDKKATLPVPSATTNDESSISKLEKLADLRDRGVLTDEEFQSEKKKILLS